MATTIGWGLIGARGLASSFGAPAIEQARGARLVAVMSSDPQRARAFAGEHGAATAATSIDGFLAAPELDAVWIASPTSLHYEQARAALRAGKHALVEKPLAGDAEQAWELVRIARDAGLVLATGYQARYVPSHIAMRALIADGAIGQVSIARTYYGVHRSTPPPAWRRRRASARWGALGDAGTHHVDLLRMLLGDVAGAVALSSRGRGYETEDTASAALRFEQGALGALTASTHVWQTSTRVEVHGTDGMLLAVDTSPRGAGTATLLRRGRAPEDITGARPLSFTAQVETLGAAIAGEDVAYASGEDGARNVEILERLVP